MGGAAQLARTEKERNKLLVESVDVGETSTRRHCITSERVLERKEGTNLKGKSKKARGARSEGDQTREKTTSKTAGEQKEEWCS